MIFSPYITLDGEWDNALAQDVCRHALVILRQTYPGYSWRVMCKQGVCFIRMLDSRLRHPWGINLKLRAVDHDIEFFKRQVKFAAGEFLERCGLSRVGNLDEFMKRMEGIPQRSQPVVDLPADASVFDDAPHILRAA